MKNRTFIQRFGQVEGEWLADQIHDFWDAAAEQGDPYECVDSERTALKGDEGQEALYDDAITCCGSCDVEFGPSPAGHTYKYGFNYGH